MPVPNLSTDVLDLSLPEAHSPTIGHASDLSVANVANNNGNIRGHEIYSRNDDSSKTDAINETSTVIENDLLDANVPQSRFTVVASTSSLAIREISLPSKRPSVGRPKGSSQTVIGTKRKGTVKPTNKKTEVN